MPSDKSTSGTEHVTGHIDTPDGGAMDVYLDGERMTYRDGYRTGHELEHYHDGSATSVFVRGKEGLGVTNVSGEHWEDEEDAFWRDGEIVEFEHKVTEDDSVLLFEAVGDHNHTVEIREVTSS